MKISIFLSIAFFLASVAKSSSAAPQKDYNILDYGAIADSAITSTAAINKAIDDCYSHGGGSVIIPAGFFKSGTIILKDYVTLHLEQGAHLFASNDYADFPRQPITAYRSLKDAAGWYALIYAANAHHIAITGSGIIDGRGYKKKGRPEALGGDRDGRPRNILFISCQYVTISGIQLKNAAMWNQHYLDCEDVRVDGISVYNHCNGNNDGIDIDGCRRFILSNSVIDSDDDGIVLKSTGTAACEDIAVSNCIVSSFANAIKCGTESTGGFRRIMISNCIVKPSRHKGERILKSTPSGITAISLEIVDGGVMDGVSVDNIMIEGTECPLYVRLGNRARKHIEEAPTPAPGKMRNIRISNISAYGTGNFCSSITGVPGARIENILLYNIQFTNRGGIIAGNIITNESNEQQRHDVASRFPTDKYLPSLPSVKEDEKGYPQPTVWGNLPSSGLFLRHIDQIEVRNAIFSAQAPDARVPIMAADISYIKLADISLTSPLPYDTYFSEVKRYESKGLRIKNTKSGLTK